MSKLKKSFKTKIISTPKSVGFRRKVQLGVEVLASYTDFNYVIVLWLISWNSSLRSNKDIPESHASRDSTQWNTFHFCKM